MTYDLFGQAFLDGEAASREGSAEAVLDVLRPFAVEDTVDRGVCHTRTPDGGEADFYVDLEHGGFMANRFSPGETTELVVRAAAAAGLVLLGPDLPAILTDFSQLRHLPEGVASRSPLPVLVISGAELDGLIAGDEQIYGICHHRLSAGQ